MEIRELAERALALAQKFAGDNTSAQLCAEDAEVMMRKEYYHICINRSLTSLRHSVGIFSPDYREVATFSNSTFLADDIRKFYKKERL